MKKFLCVLLLLFMAGNANALEMHIIKIGMLSKMNATETQFSDTWKKTFAPNKEILQVDVKFYDTLTAMQMALDAGQIQQMVLPESVASYVLDRNKEYESVLALPAPGMGLAFGFREDSKELRDKFNEALRTLRDDWTLAAIEGNYISSTSDEDPDPVEFKKYDGADTIRIAVTGDLPPIDFIAADGTPAGYNTAVLAEIASLLKVNVKLINIEAGARSAALASNRADVIFWYEVDTTGKNKSDIPDGVILSEPYYTWSKFIHIRKPLNTGKASRKWNYRQDFLNLYLR